MSKDVSSTESRKPVSFGHGAAVVGVAVVGAIIAFWVLSSLVGIFVFIVKVVVVVALIGGAFWLVGRIRR